MLAMVKSEADLIRAFRLSPLLWVEKMFRLVPQHLKKGISPDEPAEFYKPEHFEPFSKGKNLTWQQWLILRSVEWAMQGKASRRISVRSGRGIGKSAVCSWIILWFLFCFKDAQ